MSPGLPGELAWGLLRQGMFHRRSEATRKRKFPQSVGLSGIETGLLRFTASNHPRMDAPGPDTDP